MNECPNCDKAVYFEEDYVDITSDWVQIVIKCPECGCELIGDIQIDDFVLEFNPEEEE
jgi:hypothetical protein